MPGSPHPSPRKGNRLIYTIAGLLILVAVIVAIGRASDRSNSEKKENGTHSRYPAKTVRGIQPSDDISAHRNNSSMRTRSWSVPADLIHTLMRTEVAENVDPFSEMSGVTWATAQGALERNGIPFPPRATARLDIHRGKLRVYHSPERLEELDQLLSSLGPMTMFVLDQSLFDHPITPPEPNPRRELIKEKLRTTIIPEVDFQDLTYAEAFSSLQEKIHVADQSANPLKLRIEEPNHSEEEEEGGLALASISAGTIQELKLQNVPVSTVLSYLCDTRKIRYRIDEDGVTLLALGSYGPPPPLATSDWQVDPRLIDRLAITFEKFVSNATEDPFADQPTDLPTRTEWSSFVADVALISLLENQGVNFPEGARVTYSQERSSLHLVNTEANTDLIATILTHHAITLSREIAEGAPTTTKDGKAPRN